MSNTLKTILLALFLTASTANGESPNQSLRVISDSQGGLINFETSLKSFVKLFSNGKTSWTAVGSDSWILTNESVDQMTDNVTVSKFLFKKKTVKKEDILDIQRVVIDGKDIPQILFPNILYPLKEGLKSKGLMDMKKSKGK
ncbi:hypothetical protein [Bdellovibrio bacteriovorus]|uniref:hypothetical protein n=1 Tax=Bdellovibrio bacteriovorus TaxID=959 RepID=UPI003D02B990